MEGLTATWTLNGPVKNNKWTVEHFVVDPEIKGMKIYFSDLLNGNQMLSKFYKAFLYYRHIQLK